jgi:hypothetical protein
VPPQLGWLMANGQWQLSWPVDHFGWHLETQTNPFGFGLGTNWITVAGSQTTNVFSPPMNVGNGSAFFRLAYP